MQREFLQNLFTLGRELQQYFSAVFRAPLPAYEASSFEPIHQFHGAVMMNLQPLCDFCDPRPDIEGQALNRQQKLVLAGLKTCVAGGALAEAQKAANLVPELG
jgi:hypothetical protein